MRFENDTYGIYTELTHLCLECLWYCQGYKYDGDPRPICKTLGINGLKVEDFREPALAKTDRCYSSKVAIAKIK